MRARLTRTSNRSPIDFRNCGEKSVGDRLSSNPNNFPSFGGDGYALRVRVRRPQQDNGSKGSRRAGPHCPAIPDPMTAVSISGLAISKFLPVRHVIGI
jgi:hypothetical protein